MKSFEVGDRVEHVAIGRLGTVEHVGEDHVRVRWDNDWRTGLLYYDDRMIPCTKQLIILPAQK